MVSYFKTQWFNVLMGVVDLGVSIYHFCTGDDLWGIGWTVIAVMWFLMSFINYNDDRLKLLEKKQERDDSMYELVQELVKAKDIDRKYTKALEERIKLLEGKKK
jgi:hypothetical protein